MQIPNRVKISGLEYVVEETPHLTYGQDYNGEIHYDQLKINLRPINRSVMQRVFIHECLHGIFDNLGHKEHDEKHIYPGRCQSVGRARLI